MASSKGSKILDVEARFCKKNETIKDLLMRMYIGERKSLSEIADALTVKADEDRDLPEINVSKSLIFSWMEKYDIPMRENVPSSVIESIEKSNLDDSKNKVKKTNDTELLSYDPSIEGFKCSNQCPYYGICKYQEYSDGKLCPVSYAKKNNFIKPIKSIINNIYKEDKMLLNHYNNLAEITASTYELLDRKMSYIQSEDVTQILNRPDPITGELKQVKVPNLLNGEIQRDQGMLIKLLELLRLTPKTAAAKENDENFLATMVTAVKDAKKEREEKQEIIETEEAKRLERKEIRTHDDFETAMEELMKREDLKVSDEEVAGAISIESMAKGEN